MLEGSYLHLPPSANPCTQYPAPRQCSTPTSLAAVLQLLPSFPNNSNLAVPQCKQMCTGVLGEKLRNRSQGTRVLSNQLHVWQAPYNASIGSVHINSCFRNPCWLLDRLRLFVVCFAFCSLLFLFLLGCVLVFLAQLRFSCSFVRLFSGIPYFVLAYPF